MKIIIDISGPGEAFSGPLLAVKEALENIGCKVDIQDEYPNNNVVGIKDHQVKGGWSGTNVLINVNHLPWGG